MAKKSCPPSKPRAGLVGTAESSLNPTLVTPLEAGLTGEAGFALNATISPDAGFPAWESYGKLTLDNLDVLAANLTARAIPIQNPNDQSEVLWFLDNIGGGVECCIDTPATATTEYVTALSGVLVEIPRTIHLIPGFPTVRVLNSAGVEVSAVVEYVGDSIFIRSNVPLDNHTAILR